MSTSRPQRPDRVKLHIVQAPKTPEQVLEDQRRILEITGMIRGRIREEELSASEKTGGDRTRELRAEILEQLGIEGLNSPVTEALVSAIIELTAENKALAEQNAALADENARGKDENAALAATALEDYTTGLWNKRGFAKQMERIEIESQRKNYENGDSSVNKDGKCTYVALMIDLDNFKTLNDKKGHLEGDVALRHVAEILREATRGTDIVARWAGDEFIIALLDTKISDAERVAEKIRKAIEDGMKGEVSITASIGIEGSDGTSNLNEIMNRADIAMYSSKKEGGKNKATVWIEAMGLVLEKEEK